MSSGLHVSGLMSVDYLPCGLDVSGLTVCGLHLRGLSVLRGNYPRIKYLWTIGRGLIVLGLTNPLCQNAFLQTDLFNVAVRCSKWLLPLNAHIALEKIIPIFLIS